MYRSILRRTALIVTAGLLAMMPLQPVVAEEFDIVHLIRPSSDYQQPSTFALVDVGYVDGLEKGMSGISYQVLDVDGTRFPSLEMYEVDVYGVTPYASSCLIRGLSLEEITSECVVSFELPDLQSQDYRRMAIDAMAAKDFEKAQAYWERLVQIDSLSADSSDYSRLDSCRTIADRKFDRKLSKKAHENEKRKGAVYSQLGRFFFSHNSYSAARYYLERTVRANSKSENAKRLLCLLDDPESCLYTDTTQATPPDIFPELIYTHKPKYPRRAKQDGITGLVWVRALVDRSGLVAKALVETGSGSMALDQAAVRAAYYNKFRPAYRDGKPGSCWVMYKVAFVLD